MRPANKTRLNQLLNLILRLALILLGAVPLASPAQKQWPAQHPIHLIVPFPAGSSPDLLARVLVEPLSNALSQNIIVENKPGAGGNIGTRTVAHAAPDGYTLLYTINGPLVTAPALYKKTLGYAPLTDLAPITLVATSPNILVAGPAFKGQSLADFVQQAKARPGAFNYGSVGSGSASQLAMEMFEHQAGIDLLHIPYAGFPQIMTALIAGDIQAAFMVPAIAMSHIKAGRVQALGLTSAQPLKTLPGIMPLAQLGYPGFEAISWNAILAPAGTPAPILTRLQTTLAKIISSPQTRLKFEEQYFTPVGSTPEALRARIKDETTRWVPVIEQLQISLD